MTLRERIEDRLDRRSTVVAILLLILALLGAGLGTLAIGPDGPDGPPVVTVTPTTPTPDGPSGTPDATPTPEPPGPGTPDETPTPEPPGTDTPDATPTATPTSGSGSGGGGGGGGGGGSGGGSSVTLQAVGSSAILQYSGLKPTDAGRDSIVLENAGSTSARLDIANVTVSDDENGIVSAEASVDTAGNGGELSEYVMLVIEVEYPDGTVEYFYNTDGGARSLSDLAGAGASTGSELGPGEEATVTFDWRVPDSTGNVIQSDRANFTVDFRLQTT